MPASRKTVLVVATALASVLTSTSAGASTLGCQRTIEVETARYFQGRVKALQHCEDQRVRGLLHPSAVCTNEARTQLALSSLSTRLSDGIARRCGGDDRVCGNGDDEPLASLGWVSATCPDLDASGCANPIASCDGVSTCVHCVGNVATGQALGLAYSALERAEFGSRSTVNKCQVAIGKEVARYLRAKSKILQRCWDHRLDGVHANRCPIPGDGVAERLSSRAALKLVARICRACGGPDRICDGTNDLTPPQIGFVVACPDVTPPDAPASCGAPVIALRDLADCVVCVSDFDAGCVDRLAVPQFEPYPPECSGSPTTTSTVTPSTATSSSSTSTSTTSSTSTISSTSTTSTTTPTTTTSSTTSSSTSTSTSSSSSTSSTSTSSTSSSSTSSSSTTSSSTTSTSTPPPILLDLTTVETSGTCGTTYRSVAGISALKHLGCGQTTWGGGLSHLPSFTTPAGSTNRFLLSCAGTACTVGATSTAGATYDCTSPGCRFGVPTPLVNAGLTMCLEHTFLSSASGVLNLTSGSATLSLHLNARLVLTGNPTQPCPICRNGSIDGAVCAGTVDAPCDGVCDSGARGGETCGSRNAQGLSRDCPTPAVTSGSPRCYRGANDGAACFTSADCPGGYCAQLLADVPISPNPLTTGTSSLSSASGIFCPGQTSTQKGAFRSDICRTGANSGAPCSVAGTSEAADVPNCGAGALCRPGTLNNYCTAGANEGLGCATASHCPGGSCVRAGTVVQLIRGVGSPAGPLTPGVSSELTLASVSCLNATTNPMINATTNLPGPATTSIRASARLLP